MNTRLERVAQLVRDEIANILLRDLHDPLIGFVTLTEVEVSSDLRHAKVFFSVLGDEEQVKDSIKGLLRARKHINALLADRLDLRNIPKIRLVYDETAAKAQRMQDLLRHEQEVLGPALERHEAEEQAEEPAAELVTLSEAKGLGPSSRPAAAPQDDTADDTSDEDEDFDDQFEDEELEEDDFEEEEDGEGESP